MSDGTFAKTILSAGLSVCHTGDPPLNEALVVCGEKLLQLLIAYFLGNTYAKYYENPIMLSRVTAKNVGDVF